MLSKRPMPIFSSSSFLIKFIFFKLRSNFAAKSLLMPRTLRQSPRLGVSSISIISVLNALYSFNGLPMINSPMLSSSTIMPSFISPRPSSRAEQSIPQLSTPLSFAFLIVISPIFAPSRAQATI